MDSLKVEYEVENTESSILSEARIQDAIIDVKKALEIKLKNGYCSTILIRQIAIHRLNGYEKFGSKYQNYHGSTILDTIEACEHGENVNIRPFKGNILNGLNHLHHNSNTFISKNIINSWKAQCRGKNEIEYQNIRLNEIYEALKKKYSEEIAKQKSITVLLHEIHNKSINRDFQKKTGEWIVFAEHIGVKYYLCLATHEETKEFGDEVILKRIDVCFDEFQELKRIQIGRK